MANTTKAKISLSEGIIELEGSEEFVKSYLDEFKELIKSPPASSEVKAASKKTTASAPKKKAAPKKAASGKKGASKITPERFDIHGAGDTPSLQDFLDEKKPGTGNGNIIATIGYYITELLNEDKFSEGQIEYAYKILKLKRPNHLHQIMINEKNKRDLFEPDSENSSQWTLTRGGEIFVSDLPNES